MHTPEIKLSLSIDYDENDNAGSVVVPVVEERERDTMKE